MRPSQRSKPTTRGPKRGRGHRQRHRLQSHPNPDQNGKHRGFFVYGKPVFGQGPGPTGRLFGLFDPTGRRRQDRPAPNGRAPMAPGHRPPGGAGGQKHALHPGDQKDQRLCFAPPQCPNFDPHQQIADWHRYLAPSSDRAAGDAHRFGLGLFYAFPGRIPQTFLWPGSCGI